MEGKEIHKGPQPEQRNFDFMNRPFSDYPEEERHALAKAVRNKNPKDLTDEEERYKLWMESLGTDDNPYKH